MNIMYRKYDTSPRSFHFLPTIGSPLLGPGNTQSFGWGTYLLNPRVETPTSGMDPNQPRSHLSPPI